jgi:chemotaxis signal transduction protein
MIRLQALPLAYCHEERNWYRGLTALDQNVIPVVNPEGFLNADEIALLDASLVSEVVTDQLAGAGMEIPE